MPLGIQQSVDTLLAEDTDHAVLHDGGHRQVPRAGDCATFVVRAFPAINEDDALGFVECDRLLDPHPSHLVHIASEAIGDVKRSIRVHLEALGLLRRLLDRRHRRLPPPLEDDVVVVLRPCACIRTSFLICAIHAATEVVKELSLLREVGQSLESTVDLAKCRIRLRVPVLIRMRCERHLAVCLAEDTRILSESHGKLEHFELVARVEDPLERLIVPELRIELECVCTRVLQLGILRDPDDLIAT
mmetsp:Transcript_1043/g.2890  ORF Transcript_1043/g.2890 Transcript_1043/m.2890 type:complete len:245 (-) Transcript_1043:897-1631(-)